MGDLIDLRARKILDENKEEAELGEQIQLKWEEEGREEYKKIAGNVLFTLTARDTAHFKRYEQVFISGYVAGKSKMFEELLRNAANQISAETNNGETDRTPDETSK